MKKYLFIFALILLPLMAPFSIAKGLTIDFIQSTPVGSWQLREDSSTDHKGRQTVSEVRTSMLSEETRDGEKHYWIEMAMQSYKVKKGKRKGNGDRVIMKTLIPASALQGDPANAVNNLRAFGKEIIMQSGKDTPMLIRGAGSMADSMMQSMGTKVNYAYQSQGNENVTVPAGSFDAQKIQGSGNTEVKIMFHKMSISSDNTAWISGKIPFGMVKNEGQDINNGKKSTHTSQLMQFGMSGATSQITGEPKELEIPDMPDMKGIFGG